MPKPISRETSALKKTSKFSSTKKAKDTKSELTTMVKFADTLDEDLTKERHKQLKDTVIKEIFCEPLQADRCYKFLQRQLLKFMEKNGPASIFSTDSYDQIMYNSLFRMLKRLKYIESAKALEVNIKRIDEWFGLKRQRFKGVVSRPEIVITKNAELIESKAKTRRKSIKASLRDLNQQMVEKGFTPEQSALRMS